MLLERQRAQNFLTLHLTGELSRLLELFNRNEVSALVTKGPVVAVQGYAHVGMLNLDLLSG